MLTLIHQDHANLITLTIKHHIQTFILYNRILQIKKILRIILLLGRFEVEKSKLEQVDKVEEAESKYRHENHILKWTLRKYNNRKLYLFCDNEDELKSWMDLFRDYKQVRESFFHGKKKPNTCDTRLLSGITVSGVVRKNLRYYGFSSPAGDRKLPNNWSVFWCLTINPSNLPFL